VLVRVIATVLLAGGSLCIASSLRDDASAAPPRPAATRTRVGGTTPLLSPRRLPALFDDIVDRQRLQASVDFAFGPWNACVAVDDDGTALARRNADAPLAPASTQKLATGAAALAVFGPGHRFDTRVVTTAPVENGVVHGDVYVVGGGDPVLATPAFEAALRDRVLTSTEPVTPIESLAAAIAGAGISRIDGALIGDDTRHDDTRFLPVWKPNYRTDGEIGALSALGLDHGFWPTGTALAPADPAATTVTALAQFLVPHGIAVGGGTRSGTAPAGASEVARVESPPLAQIVAAMLRASDNYIAETLAREVGVEHAHDGTSSGGAAAVVDVLHDRGIDTDGVALVDGSGLAPTNRLTCDALVGVMDLASQPRFRALDRGLAVAGQTGTLARRFVGDPLQGVLRAKTGHIDGVAGFVGIVDDAEHLRFAFLVNGQFTTAQGEALQATVARLVAAYPQAAGGTVVPAP
jgi:D-alanyl-D-alanine carboxypeptidase/D-alanyl-D-alanine-endopeptidase (penicillin-binding protein 4)